MPITPKYVIVGENDEVIDTRKDLTAARELVKGTKNRIYNLETKSYESLTDEMDKYALKREIIDIADSLDRMAGHLTSPACVDDETGMLRAKAYSAMLRLHKELKQMIYQIH